jgi:signal transduction histidine kinase/DNA-binding response OmpR family regulator
LRFLLSIFCCLCFACHCLQAGLIAHYDFGDGDLLDNELGPDYTLRAMQPIEASLAQVTLNRLAGTAVFPGGAYIMPWLETAGPGAVDAFTVSFWFRTDQVRQGARYAGLFATSTDAAEGNWMVYSSHQQGGALQLLAGFQSPNATHAPGVWQHVLVRRSTDDTGVAHTEFYLTALGSEPGEPLFVDQDYETTMEKIVLGNNHRLHFGYAMELANVKIYDDDERPIAELFTEGSGTRSFEEVPLFSIHETLDLFETEAGQLRGAIRELPQVGDSLPLDAYGYHSDYLPAMEALPDEPRWVLEIESELQHSFNECYLVPAADRRVPGQLAYGFPQRFRLFAINTNEQRELLADWRDQDYPDPGRFPARFAGTGAGLSKLILEVYRGRVEDGREFFALDEVLVRSDYFVIKNLSVQASGSFESLPFWSADYLIDQQTSLGLPVRPRAGATASGPDFSWQFPDATPGNLTLELDLGSDDDVVNMISLYPAQPPEGLLVPGYGFPGSVKLAMFAETSSGGRRLMRHVELTDLPNPGNNVIRIPGHSLRVRWIRLEFGDLPVHSGRTTFAMGEIDVMGRHAPLGREAAVQMEFLSQRVVGYLDALTDGVAGGGEVIPMIHWLDGFNLNRSLSQQLTEVETLQTALAARWAQFRQSAKTVGLSLLIGGLLIVTVFMLFLRLRNTRRLRRRIEQEQRQTEIEQMKIRFFTHISHELRTPLTLILAPLEKALGRECDPDQQKSLNLAHDNAKKLQGQVDQLLDFRKLQDGRLAMEWTRSDLIRFVRKGFGIYQSMASDKAITYQLSCPEASQRLVFDAGKLQQIMDNLIGNALKYTPEGGQVRVRLSLDDAQWITFIVEDTGVGIVADDLPHVFGQYFRADGLQSIQAVGSGIGLSFVKELVELWEGEITVESPVADGKGTRFSVRLPAGSLEQVSGALTLSDVAAESAQPATSAQPTTSNEQPTIDNEPTTSDKPVILLVEDNADVRAFVRDELLARYTILEAENGQLGLEQARQAQPDLVLSDVMMPVMNGVELCRQLKADPETSHLPVILLTARGSQEHQLEGLDSGADDYIPKPFSLPILLARVRNLLAARQQLRERFGQEITAVEPAELTVNPLDEQVLQQAIEAVEAQLDNDEFSVEDLAATLSMSSRTLRYKLKALVDQSPQVFIRTLRLKHAAQQLRTSSDTIAEIAAQVGFLEPTHFSRGFKQQFGMTPSQYRKGE